MDKTMTKLPDRQRKRERKRETRDLERYMRWVGRGYANMPSKKKIKKILAEARKLRQPIFHRPTWTPLTDEELQNELQKASESDHRPLSAFVHHGRTYSCDTRERATDDHS